MITQGGSSFTLDATTPFEIGSVSKVFTLGIYNMLQSAPNMGGTLGEMLGTNMPISSAVSAVPIQ